MRAVNLLPSNAYAPKQRLPHAPVVLAATVPALAGALVYLGYSVEHSKVVDRQNTLGTVHAQIAAMAPSPTLVNESATVASARVAREGELADALSKRVPWDLSLEQIARVFPKGAWLSTLNAQPPTPATSASTTGAASMFTITGYADTHATVAFILARLQLVPSLTDVALVSSTDMPNGKKTVVQFNITASVRGAS